MCVLSWSALQAGKTCHSRNFQCYSNLAINLKLPDDAKNITKLYDIQMVGLTVIQSVSWCFQIDIVSKFSKSNGKPNFMYQYQYVSICKKRFLPQKVRYSFPSSIHEDSGSHSDWSIGPATFQTFEAGTAPQPFGWSSHPVRRFLKKKKSSLWISYLPGVYNPCDEETLYYF